MSAVSTSVRLHVTRSGSGPPLVFTHGVGASCATWNAQVARFSKDHTVVVWDLRGHGRSERPDGEAAYGRDDVLADLDDVLVTLDPAGGPPVLVGHSLGGYVSLAYVLTRDTPVRALVLLATGPGYRDPAARAKWNAMITRADSGLGIPAHVAHIGTQHDALVMDGLTSVAMPTLLLVGEKDRRYEAGVSYMERKMPHARAVTIVGAGHNLQETHPDEVDQAIEEFLAELA